MLNKKNIYIAQNGSQFAVRVNVKTDSSSKLFLFVWGKFTDSTLNHTNIWSSQVIRTQTCLFHLL